MRSNEKLYILAGSFLLLLCALQSAPRAAAQQSCTITYTCPNGGAGGCASNMGGAVTTRGPFQFASNDDCYKQVRSANSNIPGVDIKCSCSGGASTTGSKTAVPAVPSTSGNLTPQQQLGMAIGKVGASMLQQGIHNLLYGNPAPPPDPAEQQRQVAAQQLNNSGIYLLKQRNYAGAINEFQQALANSPNDANILYNLQLARQAQKNAAIAGHNSDALGQLLGTSPETAGNSGSTLNLVSLGPDASAVDLRNVTGSTVDPAALKGQLDSVFLPNSPTAAASGTQSGQPQAQDIDKLFQSSRATATQSAQPIDKLFQPSQVTVTASQQPQVDQVQANKKQLDQLFGHDEDLKDGLNDTTSSLPSNGANQTQPQTTRGAFGAAVSNPTDLQTQTAPSAGQVNAIANGNKSPSGQLNSGAALSAGSGDLSPLYNGGATNAAAVTVPRNYQQRPTVSPGTDKIQTLLNNSPDYQKALANQQKAQGIVNDARTNLDNLRNAPVPDTGKIQDANNKLAAAESALNSAQVNTTSVQKSIIYKTHVIEVP